MATLLFSPAIISEVDQKAQPDCIFESLPASDRRNTTPAAVNSFFLKSLEEPERLRHIE